MIRRIRRTLPRFATIAALLLLVLPAQADDIEPEPYVEEEVEPEPEPEPESEEEKEPEVAEEPDRNIEKFFDLMLVRPLYLSRLIVGIPFFIFYPFTIPSGWDKHVVALLWTEPYKATFKRPLGEAPGDY
jgi:hypothetical protein